MLVVSGKKREYFDFCEKKLNFFIAVLRKLQRPVIFKNKNRIVLKNLPLNFV